jgi:predicted RNase H-like HicB family nuclease
LTNRSFSGRIRIEDYKNMLTKDLRYNIVIMPDRRTGTNEPCYLVECPNLGLADQGDTIEEALENIKKLITFHVNCLKAEGEEVKDEAKEGSMLTTVHIPYPA